MIVQITCPHCGAKLNISQKALGREASCPACGRRFQVPEQLPPMASKSAEVAEKAGAVGTASASPSLLTSSSEVLPSPPAERSVDQPPPTMLPPPVDALQQNQGEKVFASASPPPIPKQEVPPPSSGDLLTALSLRPFPLVWIVFYWVAVGLALLIISLVSIFFTAEIERWTASALSEFRSWESKLTGRLITELATLVRLGMFHLGLLTLVVCYGLWTLRKWGMLWARVLSMVQVGAAGLAFFLVFAGYPFVLILTHLLLSIWIMIYLCGIQEVSDRIRKYYEQLRSQTLGFPWTESK